VNLFLRHSVVITQLSTSTKQFNRQLSDTAQLLQTMFQQNYWTTILKYFITWASVVFTGHITVYRTIKRHKLLTIAAYEWQRI